MVNLQLLISLRNFCQSLIGGVFRGIASFHLSVISLAFFHANSKCQVALIIVFCNLATSRRLHFASFPVTF